MLAHSNKRPFVHNTILAGLRLQDLAEIGATLEPTVLKQRMILQEPKKRVQHVYFIESGLVSLRIVAAGSVLENAMVGYRGAIGASYLLGGHVPTHQSVVLFPGSALRIHVDDLRRAITEIPLIRMVLSQYVQALALHCAQTCLCGIRHDREQRLACWLCLASDAADSHVLPVTHDYLSAMLGLRRAGVTEALNRFEEQSVIGKMRGVLRIEDRKRLEQMACSCYGIVAGAYASPEQQLDRYAEVCF